MFLIVVECPSVSSPKSGSFALDTNGVKSVSVFICNAGYTILGSVNITCDIAGTWSDEFPKCGKYVLDIQRFNISNFII